ncbi:hypothetical protein [Oryzihumus sp.]|uniref:hypothetical protein n=1 Tax=Oryzihumus sp. TaxID=1968903 RepID=UPI002EDB7B0A
MAGFVQIIEFTTSRFEELQKLVDDYRAEREGGPGGPTRGVVARDRDNPNRYVNIVEFPSYQEAMANSERADTTDFAARMAALCDAPPTFSNLDVVEEWTR